MTDLPLDRPPAAIPTRFDLDAILVVGAVLVALSLAVTLPAMALDPRTFQGDPIWLKPAKFQVALAVYLLTLAFYAAWVPDRIRRGRAWRAFAIVVVLACIAEILWIGGAAMFGTASHFNTDNRFMTWIYTVMGVLAVTLTSASLVIGVAIARDGVADPLRLALALGLILTFALTLVAAGTLSGREGHFVGTPATGAAVPILGWSREVGDLRVAHFLATHAMHVVPALGFAAAALPARPARLAVWAGAAAWATLTGLVFAQALAGRPVWPL